ncbi:baculoviral IAP repeat-containing protein 3 [Biomphalaria pfeifferi]|uniref:Baculoviral IAP repeat-containing protein 3 n=1 Tax=Biomphalaria pfeifferi TaxID=112525 RepID=A0AAD8FFP5_BIOPF|nr:baculoviral IAP repeat-containing protein 3 [Biomphalaria pfeifferi]
MQYSKHISSTGLVENNPLLKSEIYRLATFATYPINANKPATMLAANGFFYIGEGENDNVWCYFCGKSKDNWLRDSDIARVHAFVSPVCPMVKGTESANIPWSLPTTETKDRLRSLNIGNTFVGGDVHYLSASLSAEQPTTDSALSYNAASHSYTLSSESHISVPFMSLETSYLQSDVSNATKPNISEDSNGFTTRRHSLTGNYEYVMPESSDEAFPFTNIAAAQPVTSTNSVVENSESVMQSSTELDHQVGSGTSNKPITESQRNITGTSTLIQVATSYNSRNAEDDLSSSLIASSLVSAEISSQSTNMAKLPLSSGDRNINERQGPTYLDLNIVTERPKRPEYALNLKRVESFASWPRDHHLSPKELAAAGFYYAGYGDCSRCFCCGGGLRNWEDEDDVWIEHARWFPKCAFVRQKLGQLFIDTVQELCKEFEQISMKMVADRCLIPVYTETIESSLKRDPAVRAVLTLGYTEKDAIETAALLKEETVPLSSDVLLERLSKEMKCPVNPSCIETKSLATKKDIDHLRDLKERNNQLRQQTVCKICMDQEVAVVFLPCGHLVSCSECAIAMIDCPVCRTKVKGIVRAFMD